MKVYVVYYSWINDHSILAVVSSEDRARELCEGNADLDYDEFILDDESRWKPDYPF